MCRSVKIHRLKFIAFWLLLGSSIGFCSLARAERTHVSWLDKSYYKIEKLEGTASYRIPFRVDWEPLREGLVLPIGSVLQINKASAVELSYRHKNEGDFKSHQSYVRFDRSLTLILDKQLLRKLEMDTYFINTARGKDLKNAPKLKEFDSLDFQKAWKRLLNVMRDPENSSISNNLTFEDEVKVAVRQKKITMLLPVDGDSRITTRFPMQLPLVWVNPFAEPRDFKIYFCKYTEKMGEPIARVRGDSYALTITEPGSYLVRVTSLDQRFASKTHMVHVLEENPDIIVSPRVDKNEHKLVFPPDNFVYQTDVIPAKITFIGSISLLKSKAAMALHIVPLLGHDRKPGKQKTYPLTADFALSLALPAGPYQWWIEYDSWSQASGHEAVKIEKMTSEIQFLHVLGQQPSEQKFPDILHSLLEESIATGKTAQFYLAKP